MLASAVITKSPFMNDSSGFINMSVIRDPLYPLFLLLFRTVFGDTLYIPVVQVLQSLFVAFAIWSLVMYIKKVFKLNAFIATIMMGGLLVSFAGYAFVSLSGAALTAQILSEGLTIPLFLLLIRFLLQVVVEENLSFSLSFARSPLFAVGVITLLCILTQGRMLYLIVLVLIALFYVMLKTHTLKKEVIKTVVLCVSIVIISGIGVRFYHLVVNGEFVSTPFLAPVNALGKMIYVSDVEDSKLFKGDDETKEVFELSIDGAVKNNATLSFVKNESVVEKYMHYEANHVSVAHIIVQPILLDAVGVKSFDDVNGLVACDKVSLRMIKVLLKDNCEKYFSLTSKVGAVGLIRSNSFFQRNFDMRINLITAIWSALMYILSVALIFIAKKIDKNSKASRLMGLTLITILGNISTSTIILYVDARYAVYTVALFYVALIALICEIVQNLKNKKCK